MHLLIEKSVYKIYSFGQHNKGYLIVANNKSIMIDCPDTAIVNQLETYDLPKPEYILHTHVQDEHCREWSELPNVPVFVPTGSEEIAKRSEQYFMDCCTVWPPSREWENRGAEKYGIAGCVTERPPEHPLNIANSLEPGEIWRWENISLEIIPLPGHGKHSVGFYLRDDQILFPGDSIKSGGFLVNFFDLERSYGLPDGYHELIKSLNSIIELNPELLLPSTGSEIKNVTIECDSLISNLTAMLYPLCLRETEESKTINFQPIRELGRYREVIPGVFQNTNGGNIVLFIDAEGHGFMVDPDPCIWLSWNDSCTEFNHDLDLLERAANLKTVEYVFFTHYHGDHVQFADLLKERYGTIKITTTDIATRLTNPAQYNLPCLISWYGFPYDSMLLDIILDYGQTFDWHKTKFNLIQLPGHCSAHAGLFMEWNGIRIACTGDALMYGKGPITIGLPIIYNDAAWPDLGTLVTLQKLKQFNPNLVLCGHSFAFMNNDETILDDFFEAATDSLNKAEKLLDYDLTEGMTPPDII